MPRFALVFFTLFLFAPLIARAEGPPTTDEELAALRLADPALKVELVASEPLVRDPVAIAWDHLGRLYVAEMTDYPIDPPGGRIRRLEDRDGDGRYDHADLFAEGLPYPNGLLPWKNGVLVTAAPALLYLEDSDGDGRADVRKVVLTGFGEGNQQLRVNSPTWGLDNWVYLANGRSGGAVRRPEDAPGQAVAIPRNDLRVEPSTGRFEPIAGFSQFGLPRDDWGNRFPSWNTVPIRHVVIEDRVLARNPDLTDTRTVADILDLADGGRIYSLAPAQKRFNAESVSYFNATCGPTIYRGDLLGETYQGDAFLCEPLTSVVQHRQLEPDGPTFIARRVEPGREFLASTHSWFRPVNLATGPDGALYVVDFCRAWVEHPAFVPEGERAGVDFREGHNLGRIWRIVPRDAKTVPPRTPLDGTTADLVARLGHPNAWQRDTAQRRLVEAQDASAVEPLRTLARNAPQPVARVNALWTLEGLDALDRETIRAALGDADPHVREQAARLARPLAKDLVIELANLAEDADTRVRLQAAIALGEIESDAAREALATIAARDADSTWTAEAILSGLGGARSTRFLEVLATRQPEWLADPSETQAHFLGQIAALIGSRNEQAELARVLHHIADAPGEAASLALLLGLAKGQARLREPLVTWTPEPSGPLRESITHIRDIRLKARTVAGAEGRPPWVRVLALEVALATHDEQAGVLIVAALEPSQPVELQKAAARGLGRLADPAVADRLLERWDQLTLAARRVLIGSLVTSVPLAGRLLEAVESGAVPPVELDPGACESLRRLGDEPFQKRVETVLRSLPSSDREEVVRGHEPVLSLKGDPTHGRALFAQHCQTCHARNGQGAKVGPDLISVVGRPPADLLVSILDPSREVAPDGLGVVVATTEGQVLTGLLVEENASSIRLRRAEGLEDVVPRAEIEALRPTGRSLMPDGLEQVLAPQDLADLIAFLLTPEPEIAPAR